MSIRPTLDEALDNVLRNQVIDVNDLQEDESKVINFEAAAASVLENKNPNPSSENGKAELLKILQDNGASLDAAARKVANTLNYPENNAIGLKAAEMIFRANGLLKEQDKNQKDIPEVNITIVGTSNQTLINVLLPK